jgi:hypothetical protein
MLQICLSKIVPNEILFKNKIVLFWDMTPCILVDRHYRLKEHTAMFFCVKQHLIFPKAPSAEAPETPQPEAYCAALCYSLSTDSLPCVFYKATQVI